MLFQVTLILNNVTEKSFGKACAAANRSWKFPDGFEKIDAGTYTTGKYKAQGTAYGKEGLTSKSLADLLALRIWSTTEEYCFLTIQVTVLTENGSKAEGYSLGYNYFSRAKAFGAELRKLIAQNTATSETESSPTR